MKKSLFVSVILLVLAFSINAQNDASSGTFTDTRDNTVYKWVKIGDQVWMAENLKATKYTNGTAIPLVNTTSTWDALTATSKAYCWYNDDIANNATYGALYTWAAAMNGAAGVTANPSGVQGVCPTGWHLPSDAEWTQMVNYLADNGYNYDETTGGGRAKTAKAMAATSSWNYAPTTGGVGNTDYPAYRNKSGFTGLASGFRYFDGTSRLIGKDADWWSATENNASHAWIHGLDFGTRIVYRGNHEKKHGFTVRCLKD